MDPTISTDKRVLRHAVNYDSTTHGLGAAETDPTALRIIYSAPNIGDETAKAYGRLSRQFLRNCTTPTAQFKALTLSKISYVMSAIPQRNLLAIAKFKHRHITPEGRNAHWWLRNLPNASVIPTDYGMRTEIYLDDIADMDSVVNSILLHEQRNLREYQVALAVEMNDGSTKWVSTHMFGWPSTQRLQNWKDKWYYDIENHVIYPDDQNLRMINPVMLIIRWKV